MGRRVEGELHAMMPGPPMPPALGRGSAPLEGSMKMPVTTTLMVVPSSLEFSCPRKGVG